MKKGKWSTSLILTAWIGLLLIFTPIIAQADVPQYLSFQGKLLEDGSAITGYRNVTFSIWEDPNGGDAASALWYEGQVVHIIDGIYNVQLGAITSLPEDLHTYSYLYLQIDVIHPTNGSQRLTPLIPFNSNVFTLKAANADQATNAVYATSAGTASSAASATTATSATSAVYATSAGNADTVDGYNASDFYTQAQLDNITSDLENRLYQLEGLLAGEIAGDANIDGELVVDRVAYQQARTHYYTVGDGDFHADNAKPYRTHAYGGSYIAETGVGWLVAGLHLPDGAVMRSFKVITEDTAPGDLTVYLLIRSHESTGPYSSLSTLTTSGTPGIQTLTDTSIAFPTIDNNLEAYQVRAISSNWPGDETLRIRGAIVEYTIDEAP